ARAREGANGGATPGKRPRARELAIGPGVDRGAQRTARERAEREPVLVVGEPEVGGPHAGDGGRPIDRGRSAGVLAADTHQGKEGCGVVVHDRSLSVLLNQGCPGGIKRLTSGARGIDKGPMWRQLSASKERGASWRTGGRAEGRSEERRYGS